MRKLRNVKHRSGLTVFQKSMMSGEVTFVRKNICKDVSKNSALKDSRYNNFRERASDLIYARSSKIYAIATNERGDVPGWVLVVLMTTGLVTGIWTLAAPRIEQILRSSLDSMNGIR